MPDISRRSVILAATIVPLIAVESPGQVSVTPLVAFSSEQLKTLEAFVDRLIPEDENGPGARECGAANYIDRALADTLAAEKPGFTAGLGALDQFSRETHGQAFAELSAEARDAVLTAMDNNTATGFTPSSQVFFNRLRTLTLEGTFGDPYYGGNKAFAGWDLIGYPGPRLAVSPDEQKMKIQIKPAHLSAWGGTHGH